MRSWASREGLTLERQSAEIARRVAKTESEHAERNMALADLNTEYQSHLDAAEIRMRISRLELRERLLQVAHEMLDRLDDPHVDFKGSGPTEVTYPRPDAGSAFNYIKASATALDKYRLESGEATERSETWTLTEVDRAIRQLESQLAEFDAGQ